MNNMANYELPQMKYGEHKGLISIIVPIYNTEEDLLIECLDSILSQALTNWEAILVNDGSTYNTVKIIDEYSKKDNRFVVVHKQNQGTLLARKTGLENSKGEFIANLDHDDTYNPQFLEKMHSKIIETNADFVWCNYSRESDKEMNCATNYKWNKEIFENIKAMLTDNQGIRALTWNKLIKREIYAKVLFPNVHLTSGEDPVQIIQVVYHSKSAVFLPENLYFHRDGGVMTRRNLISDFQHLICINEIIEILFNGVVLKNIENIFYRNRGDIALKFFLLSKKERLIFEKELKPLLLEFIKHKKKLRVKILLVLASKGIVLPFKFYEWVKSFKLVKLIASKKNRLAGVNI